MKNVIRTCVSCGAKKNKRELVRFTLYDAPAEDSKQCGQGRGAYVCDNEKCRATGINKQKLMRSLQQNSARRNRKTG